MFRRVNPIFVFDRRRWDFLPSFLMRTMLSSVITNVSDDTSNHGIRRRGIFIFFLYADAEMGIVITKSGFSVFP